MSVPRFWREIQTRYNIKGSKCRICGQVYFPPRIVCRECKETYVEGKSGEKDTHIMDEVQLSGKGEILTYTTVHVAPPGFEDQVPYNMVIVTLDEGPKITGQLVECENKDISIGDRVKVVYRRIREDGPSGAIHYGYKFKLDQASG